MIRHRLQLVNDRMDAVCRRAGRLRSDVTVVAVTKKVSIGAAQEMIDAGAHDLGENRPQELWRKAAELPGDVRWHLIGHLQSNKIEKTLPLVTMIHSVDSVRLLKAIETEAARQARTVDVLLECNASGEITKQGFKLADLAGLVSIIGQLQHVQVAGLMTMAAFDENPENCRPTFAALRQARDALRQHLAPPHRMVELSMGMSNDFEVAIEEGATIVRLGTILFGA
jgi:pyridoxal phosphate enzyme (YggS family)